MQTKLLQLSSQLSDVMHQAEFMANWVQDNRLNRQQMENEFNILIAEIWDSQEQVNTLLKQTQTTTQAGMIWTSVMTPTTIFMPFLLMVS